SVVSGADARDWLLNVYTKPYPGQAISSPFGTRISAEPYLAQDVIDPANTWNQWSSGGSTNRLRFYESTYRIDGPFETWDQFGGGMSRAGGRGPGVPYAIQPVLYFSVQTDPGWTPGFVGQIDSVSVALHDGTLAYVNFDARDVIPPTLIGSASPP